MAPFENAAQKPPKPVFFAPLYVFKGQAIMVHSERHLATTDAAEGKSIAQIASEPKGMRIGVTEGTELEQIVLAALKRAGLNTSEVQIIHSAPADALAAFISGDLDAFAAGLTERIEARRHGGVELLTASDVMRPVIDGIVTNENVVNKRADVSDKITLDWFRTIRYIHSDVENNSKEILEYLRTTASTRYTPKEYAIAWTFDTFPLTAKAANDMFNEPTGKFWWKSSWDSINEFLLGSGKITRPVPYDAYLGAESLPRIMRLPEAGEHVR